LLALSSPAPAQGAEIFGPSALVGSHAFNLETSDLHWAVSAFGGEILVWSAGSFTADGEGRIVSGTRRLLLPEVVDGGFERSHRVVEQSFTGSYSVRADGTGTMVLQLPEIPEWQASTRWAIGVPAQEETVEFVLRQGGRSLYMATAVQARLRETIPGGETLEAISILLRGEAERQEDPCGEAETAFPPGRGRHVGIERGAWER
jgi:hypothetical protein